jgi:hypothetical protein
MARSALGAWIETLSDARFIIPLDSNLESCREEKGLQAVTIRDWTAVSLEHMDREHCFPDFLKYAFRKSNLCAIRS